MEIAETVDLCGLKCPLNAMIARRAALRAPPGTVLEFVADDPLSEIDLTYMCEREQIEVLSKSRQDGVLRMTVRRPAR